MRGTGGGGAAWRAAGGREGGGAPWRAAGGWEPEGNGGIRTRGKGGLGVGGAAEPLGELLDRRVRGGHGRIITGDMRVREGEGRCSCVVGCWVPVAVGAGWPAG